MRSRFDRAKKVGMISYISRIPGGIEADAVLTGVSDSGNRAGWDPLYDLIMAVYPEQGDVFEARFRRIIPAGHVPDFVVSRKYRVIYNPQDQDEVSFISYKTEAGEIVDFRNFPLRIRKMEDTEMLPPG